MTPKQKQVLEFLRSFHSQNGFAPSQQEIARHFGFKSLGTVQNYLVRLEQQGLLRKTWNARRGAQVAAPALPPTVPAPDPGPPSFPPTAAVLPLLGSVAAGKPIEALEAERTIEVPTSLLRGGDCFALKVRGDSMIGDGILDGDFVIVRKQAHATNGQTVVALIGSEATIKRYHRVGNRVELRSANPAYAPIVIDSETAGKELRIEGILTGLVRSVP